MTLSDFRYLASNTEQGFSAMGYTTGQGSFVVIGLQKWDTANLNVTTYRYGTVIPEVTDPTAWANLTTGAWCHYENRTDSGSVYGKLYNGFAVAGLDGSGTLRKLAPAGYHIPTDDEWGVLITYLGGFGVAGSALKQTGTSYWASPNSDATNSSGFTALPGGYRTPDGEFTQDHQLTVLWSDTTTGNNLQGYKVLYAFSSAVGTSWIDRTFGFSVRAIKERSSPETVLLYNLDASGTARIEAVALNTANYNLRELDRVTMINLSPSGSENIINIPVSDTDVPYRRVEKNVSGDYYIYAISPPSQQPIITRPTSGSIGIATGSTASTIGVTRSYPESTLTGFTIKITSGTGVGQVRSISANTGSQITVTPNWAIQPVSASTVYAIYGIPQYYTNLYTEYNSTTLKHQGVDYDLLANIDAAVESTSTYKVDKSIQSTPGLGSTKYRNSPVNLTSILKKQSPFASVQDSSYDSISWRNARYDGSIMTPSRNQGYPPSTHGSFIEGAFFPNDTSDSYIDNLITTNTIEYKQYFSLTDLTSPQFLLEDTNLKTTVEVSTSASILELKTNEISQLTKEVAIGDILLLTIENQSDISTERLQLIPPNAPALYSPYEFRAQTATTGEFSNIKVTRGYADTPRSTYPISSSLSRVVPVRMLELSNSKLTAVTNGKFRIKGRQDTLHISVDGYVISGSGAFDV